MAVIIDNSKPCAFSYSSLTKATERVVWNRLVACWIDYFIVFVLPAFSVYLDNSYIYWFLIISIVLYFPVLEGLFGYTVGKYICRIRVINTEGKIPGIGRAVIRTLLRILEANPFLFGAIPAGVIVLNSKTRRRLGDMLAKTYVVHVQDLTAVQSQQESADSKPTIESPLS